MTPPASAVPPAPAAGGYGPAPAPPAPARGQRRPGLPQRAPGQALGRSTLSRGGRSTGDPRYDTGSTPALPPEAAPAFYAPPRHGRAEGAHVEQDDRYVAPDQAYATPGRGYAGPATGYDEHAYVDPGRGNGAPGYQAYVPDSSPYEAYAPGTYAPDAPADPFGPVPGPMVPGSPVPGGEHDRFAAPAGFDEAADDDDAGDGERGRHARRRQRPPAGVDEAPRLPEVPGFEGLRAVALVAVLAFHQGYDLARGGFLALSSFFTLAGFLLGTLTLAEWSQSGHLALGRLWERRARRIVPSYIVALALVVVLQFALRVGTGASFRVDVLYALGFAENWRAVIAGRDAASIFVGPSPVQHLWSVGLLVQLIVVLPVAFVGLMKLTGKRWRLAGAAVAAVAVAGFAVAKLTADVDGNGGLAYFGTHTRAAELLVGVALAFAVLSGAVRKLFESEPGRRALQFGGPLAMAALLVLWATTSLDDPALFGGITALNAVLTAVVILAVTTSGPIGTVLGAWPLRTLGRFAFVAYLVHWPIYLLIDEPRVELNEYVQFAARLGATLLAAVALHYAVERPWRRGLRIDRPKLAAVLAGAAVAVLVAVIVLPQQPPPGVSLAIGEGSGPGQLDVVVPSEGSEVARVALVGDALAASLVPGATNWNATQADQQVRLATHIAEGCPPGAPGPARLGGRAVGEGVECRGWEPRLPRLLDAAEPDVVVAVTGLGELGERDLDGGWRHLGDPAYDTWLAGQLDDLAATLADAGVPVLWATIPHVRMPGVDGDWTRHAENDPRRVDRYNDLVREAAAAHDQITVVDLTAWAQDLPRGGEFGPDYRQDGTTFTERGANGAMTWLLTDALAAAGVEVGGDEGGDATTATPTTAAR